MDSAIKGFGGCPMAKDDLVGNMATENVIAYLSEKDRLEGIDLEEFGIAMQMAERIFPTL